MVRGNAEGNVTGSEEMRTGEKHGGGGANGAVYQEQGETCG